MARRVKASKRKHYGNRTFGKGNKKNNRGKGSRGGVGRGGYHKNKWMHTLKTEGPSQTEPGFVNQARKHVAVVPLSRLAAQIQSGKFAQTQGAYGIDVTGKKTFVKVLGNGPFPFKAAIKANAFSAGAKERIEKAGGSAVIAQ